MSLSQTGFHKIDGVGNTGIIDILLEIKKFIQQNVRTELHLAFACKFETLISLHSHAVLILTKFKNQVVHKQGQFKKPLTSTFLVSSERRFQTRMAQVPVQSLPEVTICY